MWKTPRRLLLLLLPALGSATCPPSLSANVWSFGAKGDGFSDDTESIQRAIDTAATLASPGQQACAKLTSGIFVSGTVYLRSDVVLEVSKTAVLKASMNATLFPLDQYWPENAVLVVSQFADRSGVTGGGLIDGQAPRFVNFLDAATDQFTFSQYQAANGAQFRVRLVEFRHSRNVTLSDITLEDSTSFHASFLNCSNVLVEDLIVHSDLRWPSCDAIDITSCNNTIVRRCQLTTGDDAISPKTWQGYGPLVNLFVEDVIIHARSGGIHFGASAWYDYLNVTIKDVRVLDSHGGMLIQVRGPGSIRGLHVSNLMVSHATFNAPCLPWMGNGHPIAISADRWRGGPADNGPSPAPAGTISDVSFENVTAQSENGIFISGRVGGVERVLFKNVHLVILQNPPNNASFGPCRSHNYWPTSGPGGERGIAAPIDGFYVESASSVSVKASSVTFVGKPKPGNIFGRCINFDNGATTGVVASGVKCLGQPSAHGARSTVQASSRTVLIV